MLLWLQDVTQDYLGRCAQLSRCREPKIVYQEQTVLQYVIWTRYKRQFRKNSTGKREVICIGVRGKCNFKKICIFTQAIWKLLGTKGWISVMWCYSYINTCLYSSYITSEKAHTQWVLCARYFVTLISSLGRERELVPSMSHLYLQCIGTQTDLHAHSWLAIPRMALASKAAGSKLQPMSLPDLSPSEQHLPFKFSTL